jgi:hypothetical protein
MNFGIDLEGPGLGLALVQQTSADDVFDGCCIVLLLLMCREAPEVQGIFCIIWHLFTGNFPALVPAVFHWIRGHDAY